MCLDGYCVPADLSGGFMRSLPFMSPTCALWAVWSPRFRPGLLIAQVLSIPAFVRLCALVVISAAAAGAMFLAEESGIMLALLPVSSLCCLCWDGTEGSVVKMRERQKKEETFGASIQTYLLPQPFLFQHGMSWESFCSDLDIAMLVRYVNAQLWRCERALAHKALPAKQTKHLWSRVSRNGCAGMVNVGTE